MPRSASHAGPPAPLHSLPFSLLVSHSVFFLRHLDLSFFDPSCPGCSEILKSRETSIGQILAIMRQWVPQTQHNIDKLIMEVLKRGAHPDDRDSLTDMSLLMYACKAGASGVGDVEAATKITTYLVELGCDLSARCRWTDMAALHYSTYFDVAPVLAILLHRTKGADVDTQCVEYESGTALHIAATNKPTKQEVIRTLLDGGAHIDSQNSDRKTAMQLLDSEGMSDVVNPLRYMSLQCLAANKIVEYGVPYKGHVTAKLETFVKMH